MPKLGMPAQVKWTFSNSTCSAVTFRRPFREARVTYSSHTSAVCNMVGGLPNPLHTNQGCIDVMVSLTTSTSLRASWIMTSHTYQQKGRQAVRGWRQGTCDATAAPPTRAARISVGRGRYYLS
eukprot:5468388-Pleurochrysis_carterae.AAC.6